VLVKAHRIEDGEAFEAKFKEALAAWEPVVLEVIAEGTV
jgi:hypothetical protein